MTFSFDSDVAKIVGVNGAVLFWNITFWVMKNKANDKHFYDGNYWTYNSTQAFTELFPFLSRQQVRTALDKLIEEELILTGDYNEKGFDRTKWYTLTRKGWEIVSKQPLDLPKSTNALAESNQPIPDINTDIEKKEIPKGISKESLTVFDETSFARFWKAYPKKKDRANAEKAFRKVKVPVSVLINALEKQKRSDEWQRDNGKYIPYPSTWLNGKRWEDETDGQTPQKPVNDRRKRLE